MDAPALLARIDGLIALAVPDRVMNNPDVGQRVMEMYQGALQLLRLVHGKGSAQEIALVEAYNALTDRRNGATLQIYVQPAALGTLRALKSDIELGLLGSVARRGAGEALGDFAVLAREAVAAGTDTGKNIAAVLTAALFEDTIRRLGAEKAQVVGRPDLSAVVSALKDVGVFKGATTTIALSYLKFRNDSLHADWNGITAAGVESCLAFVQGLLVEHFS